MKVVAITTVNNNKNDHLKKPTLDDLASSTNGSFSLSFCQFKSIELSSISGSKFEKRSFKLFFLLLMNLHF